MGLPLQVMSGNRHGGSKSPRFHVVGFLRLTPWLIIKRKSIDMNDQKPATPWFKKPWGIVLIVVLGIMVLGAISGATEKKSSSGESPKTATATAAPVDPAKLATDKARLAELKTKFNYKYDEFEKKGWYEAKSQVVANTFNTQMLKVNVNNKGYSYLEDQYYGDDWLFHTHVEVKIGDAIYKSDDVETFDPNNSQNNSGGSVWENISYTADRDNGIIKAIAESGDTPIKVRYTGGSGGVKDFTLTKRDQQAIKDAYELSNLIISTGDTGVTHS